MSKFQVGDIVEWPGDNRPWIYVIVDGGIINLHTRSYFPKSIYYGAELVTRPLTDEEARDAMLAVMGIELEGTN
jgi:hypothetical protein